ncbi:uncharacterized protein LOC115879674 [Sitophilus oryzae]|uniref:Uncharacterized protein LOC115879674 n=1 Tax=Sitophilus oryzae TaxID=7048 RepID=A0A6J2XP83_SITOR|nr:uncharacterized protein LOC115879674 [Sitophilus oryzae]
MEKSFVLLSSMSPRLKNRQKTLKNNKSIKVLALKKHFRRSSIYDKISSTENEHTVIEDSSETSSSGNSKQTNVEACIVIDSTDSEASPKQQIQERQRVTFNLNNKCNNKVEEWLNNIETEVVRDDESFFSQVSSIYDNNRSKVNLGETKIAASSTFDEHVTKRFDEMFSTTTKHFKSKVVDKISTQNNSESVNSPKIIVTSDKCTPKNSSLGFSSKAENSDEMKSLLDSIYGVRWRAKEDSILPLSEPSNRLKSFTASKNVLPVTEKNPMLPSKKDNLKSKGIKLNFNHKSINFQLPIVNKLKNLCDSDSSETGSNSSNKENNSKELLPQKLFNSISEEDVSSDEEYDKEVTRLYQEKSVKISKQKSYSFLESLSNHIPLNKCDISARIYRTSFKANKHRLVEKLFALYNEKVFNNLLPKDTIIEWNAKLRNTAGLCYCVRTTHRNGQIERQAKISLSVKVLDSPERVRDTLIHEMCHAATWILNQVSNGHGVFWKNWAFKAMRTFPEIPPIKRCHTYQIKTKYTYRCTGCGYSIGRHSKSLNIDRKRCGHCLGKFEVLLNKTSKQGDVKTVPVTPKKELTGFALFVKENYALHKEPTIKHADVMKILGQKFSEVKLKS